MIQQKLIRARQFIRTDLWREPNPEEHKTPKGIIILRALYLAFEGLFENNLIARAAALSYSSLIGLGPLIAIMVMVSGSFLKSQPEMQIKRGLLFVAPSLQEYINLSQHSDAPEAPSDLDLLISQIVSGANKTFSTVGSGIAGFIGVFVLIFVGIQLLISIEKTLNSIWGIRKGRYWGHRIVFYWTFISLGVILGLGSTALLSASTIASSFNWLPFRESLSLLLIALSPFVSFLMLVILLTLGYQFFPNTSVRFRPALMGGFIAASLLFLNNYASIFYVNYVISANSLYGSVGIILVLMLGLYFFWIFILLGAQITYAIQNVKVLTHREIWKSISIRTKESVTLGTLLLIARRFANCKEPPSVYEISDKLRVPGNVINTSIEILVESNWVTPIKLEDDDGLEDTYYTPARPLSQYTLSAFRSVFANHGNSAGAEIIEHCDPLLHEYRNAETKDLTGQTEASFEELLKSNKE